VQQQEISAEAEGWKIDAAMCLSERTPQELQKASDLLRGITAMKKRIKEFMQPMISAAYNAHQKAKASERELLQPVLDAEDIIKEKIADYRAWERAEAKKVQEAEAARQREEERARRASEAESMRELGDEVSAELIETAPISTAVAAAPAPMKTEGVHTRRTWSCEVVDKMDLIKFVAENPVFIHLLDVSTKECNALARAQKENMAIPGLAATYKETVVARS
jgi:hypothetical protein